MGNIVVLVLIAGLIFFSLRSMRKSSKTGCTGCCASCAKACAVQKKEKDHD